VDVRLQRQNRPVRTRRGRHHRFVASRRAGRVAHLSRFVETGAACLSPGDARWAAHGAARPGARRRTRRTTCRLDRFERSARPYADRLDADARRSACRTHSGDARARRRTTGQDRRFVRSALERRARKPAGRPDPRLERSRAAARSGRRRAGGGIGSSGCRSSGSSSRPKPPTSSRPSCPSSSARSTSSSRPTGSPARRSTPVRASRWTSRTRATPCPSCRRSCTATRR